MDAFISKVARKKLKLVGGGVRDSGSSLEFKLSYQFDGLVGGASVIEDAYVQVTGNTYKLVETNYSLSAAPLLAKLNPRAILSDNYFAKVN